MRLASLLEQFYAKLVGVNCEAPGGIPFAFNGRWRSKVTGFVNMTHRWYSPRMGEFITHDPMGYIDLFNLYGFASYDPINGWDPYGLEDSFFEKALTVGSGLVVGGMIGIIPAGWTVTIFEANQFKRMSPEFRKAIGLGMFGVGVLETAGGGIIGTKGAFTSGGGLALVASGGGAPVGVVLFIVGVPEMALGLAAVAEGAADMAVGTLLMSDGSGKNQQEHTTGKKRPITKEEKSVTTRTQKNANLKKMGMDKVNLRNKSYNSGKKSLEKAGFKRTYDSKYLDDPKSRAFVNKDGHHVRWDPAKNGRKSHWHKYDKTKRGYSSDGKAVFWKDRAAHIRNSGVAAPLLRRKKRKPTGSNKP